MNEDKKEKAKELYKHYTDELENRKGMSRTQIFYCLGCLDTLKEIFGDLKNE